MTYRLRDDVHWCLCAGRVVFLDLISDRYSCLPEAAEAAFLRWSGGKAEPGDVDRLQPLISRGMLVEHSGASPYGSSRSIPPALQDFVDEPNDAAPLLDVLGAVLMQLKWSLLLRMRPLAKIAADVRMHRHQHRRTRSGLDGRIARIISAFAATSLVLPSADRCLVRALAAHDLCCRNGIHPLLVFGVRMNPFRAHCWIQVDGKVLIGDFEQVRLFTPIAALG